MENRIQITEHHCSYNNSRYGSHSIRKRLLLLFLILILSFAGIGIFSAYAMFEKPVVVDQSDRDKVVVIYDIITWKNKRIDDKIEEKGGLLSMTSRSGKRYNIAIPSGELKLECEHNGHKYGKKICLKLKNVCKSNIKRIFKRVVALRKSSLKVFKKCKTEVCVEKAFNSFGRDYSILKKKALADLERDMELSVKIQKEDAETWNREWSELKKAQKGVRWTIIEKGLVNTFMIASSGLKLAVTQGLNIPSYATIIKETYNMVVTIYTGYGNVKKHIEKLNMSLGTLRYAESIDNMGRAIKESEDAIDSLKAAVRRDMKKILKGYLQKHLVNIKKVEKLDMKIIEKKLVENEIKDLDDKIRDLRLKKAQVERKISLEKNNTLKNKMEKDLRSLSKELADTEKKRKGNVKKSGKILAGMRKVEETKAALLNNMQKITLLINDLIKDPVGDAIREVLEGSEGVKKGSPMALSILKTEDVDYASGEAEKLHGSEARKMKDLSVKGSYAFRNPKNNSAFNDTDEKFVLMFGALEYLKQKKNQVSEKKSRLSGLKKTWRFIKKAASVCNAVLHVASEIGGSLSNLHKTVSLSKSGAILKAPWKRSRGTGTTIDTLKSGSYGTIDGLNDFSELILGK